MAGRNGCVWLFSTLCFQMYPQKDSNHTAFMIIITLVLEKGISLAWPGIIVVFPRGRLSHYSVKLSSTVSQYIHYSVILGGTLRIKVLKQYQYDILLPQRTIGLTWCPILRPLLKSNIPPKLMELHLVLTVYHF